MGFADDECSIDASEPAPDHLPSTLLPMVSLRKGLRPSTQRCLYSGRPAVDATPKGFTQEDWSIDAGDPAPDHLPSTLLPKVSLEQMFDHQRMALYSGLSSADATPTGFAQEEWSIDANMLRTIFRRRYSRA